MLLGASIAKTTPEVRNMSVSVNIGVLHRYIEKIFHTFDLREVLVICSFLTASFTGPIPPHPLIAFCSVCHIHLCALVAKPRAW